MKLVHDADTLAELSVYNFRDIAGCARRFADQLEAGEQGEPIRVIAVIELSEGIALCTWGENASGYELLGILEAAKFRAYEANLTEDE
jgi:hypothetical protein